MPALILVVNANRKALQQTDVLLSGEGYVVSALPSFLEARDLLGSVSPELLIADVRLEAFNGLHLAAHSRLDHPSLPVMITHASRDPVLEREAQRLGAIFVVKPLDDPEFLRRVESALGEHHRAQTMIRRWARKRVALSVEAQVGASAARIVDMSYGGLRLVFHDPLDEPPPTFDVMLPASGITVTAHRIWTGLSPTGDEVWCGAEIGDIGGIMPNQWQAFVDSV